MLNDQPDAKQNRAPIPPGNYAQGSGAPYGRPPQPPQPGRPQTGQPWEQYQQSTGSQQLSPNQSASPYTGRQQAPQSYPASGVQAGYGGPAATGALAGPAAVRSKSGDEPNFLRALFDLNFEHFVAIKFAKIIYVLGIALNMLAWLGWVVLFFIMGAATSSFGYGYGSSSGGGMFIILGVLTLLFGWIVVLINVIVLRVVIELVIAQVRTAQNTTKLAHRES